MIETQWLQSTNPAELVAFLGERITDEQRRFYVEACRKECDEEIRSSKFLPVIANLAAFYHESPSQSK